MSNHEASDPRLIWNCVKCTKYGLFVLWFFAYFKNILGRVFLGLNLLPPVWLKRKRSQIRRKLPKARFPPLAPAREAAPAVGTNHHLLRYEALLGLLCGYKVYFQSDSGRGSSVTGSSGSSKSKSGSSSGASSSSGTSSNTELSSSARKRIKLIKKQAAAATSISKKKSK